MCGIFGATSVRAEAFVDEAALQRGCDALRHRGPDDEGIFLDGYTGLGIRRLSIVDISGGRQPQSNEDGSLHIVYNGELYNFRELRSQLQQRGHAFRTQSDTEVVLHAFEEFGPACLAQFNGMFAFAIWDATNRRLFLARDRLGIKPLYYWSDGIRLVFASELRALISHRAVPRDIDTAALDLFLTLEYIPSPRTIFRSVKKVPAGHFLTFSAAGIRDVEYWDVPAAGGTANSAPNPEELTALIDDAVKCRLIGDVPAGALLSGGIDSSTVVAAATQHVEAPLKTFSIGFDDASYNELADARAVSRHFSTDHSEDILRSDISGLAEKLITRIDEPIADFSVFPTYLVSKLARRSVKVAMTGDGGDEVFGGYDTYVAEDLEKKYRRLPEFLRQTVLPRIADRVPPQQQKKGLVNKSKRFIEGAALPASLRHVRWMVFLTERDKSRLYTTGFDDVVRPDNCHDLFHRYFDKCDERDDLAVLQYADLKTYLVDNILTKVDRMSMAASLEARVPFLDHRIVEYMFRQPQSARISGGRTKVLLRNAMRDVLPGFVLQKPKQGFSIPLKQWLCGPLSTMMKDTLSATAIRRQGYFDPTCVADWIEEHENAVANHSHRLWALTVFGMWLDSVRG